MSENLKLNVIEGDYGLVSLDVGCIQSILHAKLCNAPVEINILNSIRSCALYTAPSLHHGKEVVNGYLNIATKLKNLYGNIDSELTAKQASESLALTNLITSKMKPVLDFMYWVDPRNSDEFTSRWFMKALPFPFNYSYVKRKKQECENFIETLYPLDTDIDVIKDFITKSATQCLSTVSTRLGSLKYFYGDKPTHLDVLVYAHLAPLMKLPFSSNGVSALLSMWPNLSEYVRRIDNIHFPEVRKEVKYLENDKIIQQDDNDVSYMAVFILVVSAASLVVGFALKRGIFKISILD